MHSPRIIRGSSKVSPTKRCDSKESDEFQPIFTDDRCHVSFYIVGILSLVISVTRLLWLLPQWLPSPIHLYPPLSLHGSMTLLIHTLLCSSTASVKRPLLTIRYIMCDEYVERNRPTRTYCLFPSEKSFPFFSISLEKKASHVFLHPLASVGGEGLYLY